jgi:hypothetical protein
MGIYFRCNTAINDFDNKKFNPHEDGGGQKKPRNLGWPNTQKSNKGQKADIQGMPPIDMDPHYPQKSLSSQNYASKILSQKARSNLGPPPHPPTPDRSHTLDKK